MEKFIQSDNEIQENRKKTKNFVKKKKKIWLPWCQNVVATMVASKYLKRQFTRQNVVKGWINSSRITE